MGDRRDGKPFRGGHRGNPAQAGGGAAGTVGNLSYTAASVAKKCGLDEPSVVRSLDALVEAGFTYRRTVDLGDETLPVYSIFAGHRMMLVFMLFRLAAQLANYRESYIGFHCDPAWYC